MKNILSIALVQIDLKWKDKSANFSTIQKLVDELNNPVDLLILPELFNTAFCIDDLSLAEDRHGETLAFMQSISKQKKCIVAGSFLFKEDENVFNRLFFVLENEIKGHYDKHYLFSLVGEDILWTRGTNKVILEYNGWKIQPFICYDLRFPAWCQNNDHADIQLYVASWPQKRIHHWQALLQARAIENQCYVIGVNRVGADFYGNEHNGHSVVYDFTGNLVLDMADKSGIEIVKITKDTLDLHKIRYSFWKDRIK